MLMADLQHIKALVKLSNLHTDAIYIMLLLLLLMFVAVFLCSFQ